MEKREIEAVLGAEISEELFKEALGHAQRKQAYIYGQNHVPAVMQPWYLAKLTEEYVKSLTFSKITVDLCRRLHDMETERPTKSQNAPPTIRIVSNSAL